MPEAGNLRGHQGVVSTAGDTVEARSWKMTVLQAKPKKEGKPA